MNTVENLNFNNVFYISVYVLKRFKLNLLLDKTLVGGLAFVKELINLLYKAVNCGIF